MSTFVAPRRLVLLVYEPNRFRPFIGESIKPAIGLSASPRVMPTSLTELVLCIELKRSPMNAFIYLLNVMTSWAITPNDWLVLLFGVPSTKERVAVLSGLSTKVATEGSLLLMG